MQITSFHYSRGQTLPFWAAGTMITLALLFFLANYVNAISWQVRAQNAVDSDAAAGLSVQANMFNETSTILYSAAIDEYRLRYLNQAIINTMNGVGGCDPNPGGTCDQNYQSLVSEFNVALSGYTDDVHLLGQADQLSQGGQQQDARKAAEEFGKNCGKGGDGIDCTFAFTVLDSSSMNDVHGKGAKNEFAPAQMDVVACHNVGYFIPAFFKLANSNYPVVARGAAAVIPFNTENFQPGTAVNPTNGQIYQPPETQWAVGYSAPAYTVDFSNMTVNLNWYGIGQIHPYAGTIASKDYTCS